MGRIKRGEDGCYYRVRRGKLVAIPAKWVGKTVHAQTRRKRRRRCEEMEAMDCDKRFRPKKMTPYYRTYKPSIEEE